MRATLEKCVHECAKYWPCKRKEEKGCEELSFVGREGGLGHIERVYQ